MFQKLKTTRFWKRCVRIFFFIFIIKFPFLYFFPEGDKPLFSTDNFIEAGFLSMIGAIVFSLFYKPEDVEVQGTKSEDLIADLKGRGFLYYFYFFLIIFIIFSLGAGLLAGITILIFNIFFDVSGSVSDVAKFFLLSAIISFLLVAFTFIADKYKLWRCRNNRASLS